MLVAPTVPRLLSVSDPVEKLVYVTPPAVELMPLIAEPPTVTAPTAAVLLLASVRLPASTVVAPVYVLISSSATAPAPTLTRSDPVTTPERLRVEPLAAPIDAAVFEPANNGTAPPVRAVVPVRVMV